MGSLSFAEIITILLVVLIVFGPNRLPEFAKKLGELMAQARRATSQFSKDISTEWGDAVDPIRAVKEDYDGVKKDIKDATAAITGFGSEEITDNRRQTTDKQAEAEGTSDLRPQTSDGQAEETTDHGPRTTDQQAEETADDQSTVPLSRGTGESASQRDVAGDDGSPTKSQGADTELGEA